MSDDHKDSGWRKRQIALDKMAENARELGLDYEHIVYNTGGFELEAGFYTVDAIKQMLKAFEDMNDVAKRSMEKL